MLIIKPKEIQEYKNLIEGDIGIVTCTGCKEAWIDFKQFDIVKSTLKTLAEVSFQYEWDYLCNSEFTKIRLERYITATPETKTLIIFSCGVGIQTVSNITPLRIIGACDTTYVPGFQGFIPTEFDCLRCGKCYLNYTIGICPLTNCSKGLLNGPCGGTKNSKCEIDNTRDCAWEKIIKKAKESGKHLSLEVKIHTYK